jgi:prephenate dehydrogenase
METVAIVGVGLIGASFGLGLRKTGFRGEIIGVSSEKALAAGLACGAISSSATLAEAAQRADLIYLAQPVDRIMETIPKLAGQLRAGALVTDAGSTKEQIVACAQANLPAGSFLGGHPIAGKEQRGADAADSDLFCKRPYILTPGPGKEGAVSQTFRLTLRSLGAAVVEMSPQEHDATLALTSHLPQLISTALAATLYRDGNARVTEVFGPGLLDMTRLALSSPELWESILATNKNAVSEALEAFIKVLTELKETIGERELAHTFERSAEFAKVLRERRL